MGKRPSSSRPRCAGAADAPDAPPPRRAWAMDALICTLLAVATAATYWPVRHNQFVDFDDTQYVTGNLPVRHGLTFAGARWAFAHFYFNNYHPLTLLSHMLDV